MTDDHRPEIPGPDVADDAGRLEVTRRQLLVGGAALGLSLTAAGSC